MTARYLKYRDRRMHLRLLSRLTANCCCLWPSKPAYKPQLQAGSSFRALSHFFPIWSGTFASIKNPLFQVVIIRSEPESEASTLRSQHTGRSIQSRFTSVFHHNKSGESEATSKLESIRSPSELENAQIDSGIAETADACLEREIRNCVYRLHRLCTMRPASYLATLMRDFRAGLHRSNINSMFFTRCVDANFPLPILCFYHLSHDDFLEQ